MTIGTTLKKLVSGTSKTGGTTGYNPYSAPAVKTTAPVVNQSLAKAPAYTPVSGVGTKVGGWTYTSLGNWMPSQNVTSAGNASPVSSISTPTIKKTSSSSFTSPTKTTSSGGIQTMDSTYTQTSPINTPLGATTPNTPSTNIINAPNILGTDTTKMKFPEQEQVDYSKYIPSPIEQQVPDASKERDTALQDYLKELTKAPSSADAYKKAQEETQILQKQQVVNDLTGQLNSIVNRGQANQLSLIGQGRGIPEAIIGGQQAQIARETAIQALPIQAQLSAAQGNLDMANDNLDTLFKIYSDDAQNAYEYRKEVKKAVYEFATEKEKRALDKMDKLEERAYQETKDLHEEQSAYAKMAFANNQSSLGAKIAKLDYKSPTFKTDLAQLTSQIRDQKYALEVQKLQSDLVNAGTTINPKVLNTTQFKAAQAAQNLKLTLEKAKTAVQKYGNREVLSGEGAGILNSLKVQLRSEISTALEQGVVVPGEAAAFDQIAGQINKNFFIRNAKTLASLDSLSKSMDGRLALQKSALTNTYKVTPEQVDTLLNIADLSEQEIADMEALIQ